MTSYYAHNNKGQVLLFIAAITVIALGMGIAVSERTISSISRVTETDTTSRALAAAEAGAENFLSLDYSALEVKSAICKDETTAKANPGECLIDIPYGGGVDAKALVYVSKDAILTEYRFYNLNNGFTQQLSLLGYGKNDVFLCWKEKDSNEKADISYMLIDTDGKYTRGYIQVPGSKADAGSNPGSFITASYSGSAPYTNCATISTDVSGLTDPYLLRIRPVRGDIVQGLFKPILGGGFRSQGFTITSTGEINNNDKTPDKRIVKVTKSLPYPDAAFFDFAIYSDEGKVIAPQ